LQKKTKIQSRDGGEEAIEQLDATSSFKRVDVELCRERERGTESKKMEYSIQFPPNSQEIQGKE